MVLKRAGTSANMNNSSGSSGNTVIPAHRTPPAALDDISVEELSRFPEHVIDVNELPRAAQNRRERDPPDLHDVVTQQTEILAGMLVELRARQRQPAQQNPGVEPVATPTSTGAASYFLRRLHFNFQVMARCNGWPPPSSHVFLRWQVGTNTKPASSSRSCRCGPT